MGCVERVESRIHEVPCSYLLNIGIARLYIRKVLHIYCFISVIIFKVGNDINIFHMKKLRFTKLK